MPITKIVAGFLSLGSPGDIPPDIALLQDDTRAAVVQQVSLPKEDIFDFGRVIPRKQRAQPQMGVHPSVREMIEKASSESGADKVKIGINTPKGDKAFFVEGLGYQNQTTAAYKITIFFGEQGHYSFQAFIDSPSPEIVFRLVNTLGLILGGTFDREMSKIDLRTLNELLEKTGIKARSTSSQN